MLVLSGLIGGLAWRERHPVATSGDEKGTLRRNPKIHTRASDAIISEDESQGLHVLHVRLNAKISGEDLEQMALEIKPIGIEQSTILSIYYYLPGMMPGTEYWHPWAVTHSWPVFRTRIVALTSEEERRLRNKPLELPDGSQVLGSWLADDWIQSNRVTRYRNSALSDDQYANMMKQFVDSHRVTIYRNLRGKWRVLLDADQKPILLALNETPSEGGTTFEVSHGVDRYVIDRQGVLRVYGDDGELIAMPEPIKPPLAATRGITEKEFEGIDGVIVDLVKPSP